MEEKIFVTAIAQDANGQTRGIAIPREELGGFDEALLTYNNLVVPKLLYTMPANASEVEKEFFKELKETCPNSYYSKYGHILTDGKLYDKDTMFNGIYSGIYGSLPMFGSEQYQQDTIALLNGDGVGKYITELGANSLLFVDHNGDYEYFKWYGGDELTLKNVEKIVPDMFGDFTEDVFERIDKVILPNCTEIHQDSYFFEYTQFYGALENGTIEVPNLKCVHANAFYQRPYLSGFNFEKLEYINGMDWRRNPVTPFGYLSQEEVYLPKYIGETYHLFYGNTNVKKVTLGVEDIVNVDYRRYYESSFFLEENVIDTIVLPNCKSIGTYALYRSGEPLKTVELGCVEKLGYQSFYGVNNLILKGDSVAEIEENDLGWGFVHWISMGGFDIDNIYVKDELVQAYKTLPMWSSYADVIRPLSEYVNAQ